MALTTQQLLLLNNLVYTNKSTLPCSNLDSYQGQTVGDFINSIDIAALRAGDSNCFYTTSGEWADVLTAIKNDPELMRMEIATTHVDSANGDGSKKKRKSQSDIAL